MHQRCEVELLTISSRMQKPLPYQIILLKSNINKKLMYLILEVPEKDNKQTSEDVILRRTQSFENDEK